MASDHDAILVTARCSKCGRTVSAALGDLRETGVFACICGSLTRARHSAPVDSAVFSGAGWKNASDAYPRSTWR